MRGTYRLDDQQVKDRTDITIKMANVANESAEIVSDQLTAVWNNFYNGTQTLEHYADAMVALGAATASSSDEIAGGLEKFSSIADMIGLSFDYAAAALATITATTRQSEDVVGTALRTIFARIQGLKLGETLDDDTDLNKYSAALQAVGISIFDTNGELKDMDNILDELGDKWENLSKAQQVALAQTVAGVRQYNQLVSLMDNWSYFKENLAVAQNSDGELNRQAEIYAESWEAARNRVRAAAEELYSSLINDEAFIKITNGIGKIIEAVSTLTQGIGGLSTIIPGVIVLFNKLFGTRMISSFQEMKDVLWYNSKKAETSRADIRQQIMDTTTVLTQSSDSKANALALQYRKEQIALESQISAKTKDLNDNQLVGLQIQKEELKIAQDRTIELAEQYDLAKQEAAEIRSVNNIYNEKAGKKIDYVADSSFFADKYYLDEKGKFDWTKTKTYQKLGKGYELPPIINDKSRDQLLKIYTAQTEETLKFRNTVVALTELQKKTQLEGSNATKYRKEIDNIFQSNNLKRSDYAGNKNTYSYSKLIDAINDDEYYSAIGEELTAIGEILSKDFGISKEMIDKNQDAIEKMIESEKRLKAQEEANAQVNKQLRDNIIATSDKFTMYSRQIIGCVNALFQLGMAVSALTNLKDIWNNESISDAEKLTQTIFSLSMAFGSLEMIFKSLQVGEAGNFILTLLSNLKSFDKINLSNILKSVKEASKVLGKIGSIILKFGVPIGVAITAFSTLKKVLDTLGVTQKGAQEKIQKVTEAYNEQKEVLDDLNTTLEETKTKIDELNNKDNLTIIEQQELNKLKNSVELLEQQKKIQEEITKQQLKSTAEVGIKYNRNALKDLRIELQGATENSKEGFLKDLHLNSYEELLATGRKSDIEYYEKLSSASMKVAEVIQKNQEIVDNFNNSYDNYIEALSQGLIEINQDFINEKSQLDLMTFGGDKNTYGSKVINPLLNIDEISKNSDHLFSSIASGITDTNQLINLVGNNTQKVLAQSGISAQAYVEYIQSIVSTVQNNIQNLPQEVQDSINQLSKTWTTEDWQIAASLSPAFWEEVDSAQDVLTEISNRKYSIQLQVDGAEKLSELYDKLTEQNDTLKSALEEYGENGVISTETAKKLVDSGYADYLVKTADGWVLNTQALKDYQTQQDLMNKSVEEMVNEAQNRNTVDLSYLSMPENFLNNPVIDVDTANSNEKIGELRDRIIEVQENAQQLQESGFDNVFDNSNLERYLKSLDKVNENINNLSENKNAQEATIQFLTEQYADTIVQLNHAYETGTIDMDTYRAAMGKIRVQTDELYTRSSKLQNYIDMQSKGVWELKGNYTELSEAEQEQLKQMVKIHNTAKDVNEAFDNLSSTLDDTTDYWKQIDDKTITVTGELDLSGIDTKEYEPKLREQAKQINHDMSNAFKKHAISEDTYRTFLWSNFKYNPADINSVTDEITDGLVDGIATNELGTTVSNMMRDSHGIITDNMDDIYKAVSNTMGSLADLIQDFKYTINFSFEFVSNGPSLRKMIESFLTNGDYSGLSNPNFGNLTISGDETQATALANKVKSFGESIAAVGTSRKGLQAYTPKGTDKTVLDPNTVNDLLGKTKGSGSGSDDTPDHKDKKEFNDKYRDINNELERTTQLLDAIEKKEDKAFGRDK